MHLYDIALPTPLYKSFTYQSNELLKAGQFVIVPLRNSRTVGLVLKEVQTFNKGILKEIQEVLPWCLTPSQHEFLLWISNYTLSPLGLCQKMMLPFALNEIQKMLKKPLLLQGTENVALKKIVTLTPDQQFATNEIKKSLNTFTPFLLDGITGSGKTEVYFDVIFDILKNKNQALVLLPEISLTKQWVDRFYERFGFMPHLWHSQIGMKEKRAVFQSLYQGVPLVIVGARSALFLPFKNLKLIVVDEEHDTSYKQEEQLIYNARDAAIVRAKIEQCPIILSSATPSLETYYNSVLQKFKTLTLKNRFKNQELPPVYLVDKRQKSETEKGKYISKTVLKELEKNLKNKEQSLLFLNRRGFSPLTLCGACGHRLDCKGCTSYLTYHEKTQTLKCHHCHHEEAFPSCCKECGAKGEFVACGPGVERLSKEVKERFPKAKVLVVSSDMMTSVLKMKEMIDQILNEEVDIIIGTQLMAKGHHFPKLTFIGVIDADVGLSGIDLRAVEKTFQLLFQVAGRAGREDLKGRVFIQTYQIDHPVMQSLKNYDKESFLKAELCQREAFHMPPFSKLAMITLQSRSKEDLHQAAYHLTKTKPSINHLEILGPTPPPLSQVRGYFRERFLILAQKDINRQHIIRDWIFNTRIPKSVRIIIDIDPLSFI
ncbi:MAG: Primosomal protein N' [Holosporales bacterium]